MAAFGRSVKSPVFPLCRRKLPLANEEWRIYVDPQSELREHLGLPWEFDFNLLRINRSSTLIGLQGNRMTQWSLRNYVDFCGNRSGTN